MTVAKVRDTLAAQGFGIITEVDMSATLKTKLGVDLPPQLILGACRPELAHQALLADPSITALLPCNVVVRSIDEETTVLEAFDPAFMAQLASGDVLHAVVRMLEEGRDCEDVVTQLAAASKALDRAGFAIVAAGLQQCVADGGTDSLNAKKLEKLFLSLA